MYTIISVKVNVCQYPCTGARRSNSVTKVSARVTNFNLLMHGNNLFGQFPWSFPMLPLLYGQTIDLYRNILKGQSFILQGTLYYQVAGQPNKAKIETPDLLAGNGIIHIIDRSTWHPGPYSDTRKVKYSF